MSVRSATHAGSWYPSDSNELRLLLDGFMGNATSCLPSTPLKAIIVPHAGYRYSGQTAAWAYKSVNASTVKRVFIIGPSHHSYIDGCALPADGVTQYATPLGSFDLDLQVIHQLKSHGLFKTFALADDQEEHSIEMQLPFLRYVLTGPVKIVPVYVGSIQQNQESVFGQSLSRFFDDPESLFVISSDFCHWGHRFRYTPSFVPKGFPLVYPARSVNGQIEVLDRVGMDLIAAKDTQGFFKYCQSSGNTICGKNPILILLETSRQATARYSINFVHYSQSGLLPEVPSRNDSCVSYAAGLCIPDVC